VNGRRATRLLGVGRLCARAFQYDDRACSPAAAGPLGSSRLYPPSSLSHESASRSQAALSPGNLLLSAMRWHSAARLRYSSVWSIYSPNGNGTLPSRPNDPDKGHIVWSRHPFRYVHNQSTAVSSRSRSVCGLGWENVIENADRSGRGLDDIPVGIWLRCDTDGCAWCAGR